MSSSPNTAPSFLPFDASLLARIESLKSQLSGQGANGGEALPAEQALALRDEELLVAEEELRQSLETLEETRRRAEREASRFRSVFDLSPDPLFVTDPRGVLIDANLAAADLVAPPPGGWAGAPLAQYLHPDDVRVFEGAVAATAQASCRVRLRFRGKNGRSMRGSVRGTSTRQAGQVLWSVRLERGGRNDGNPVPSVADTEKRLTRRVQEVEQELARREQGVIAERRVREDAQAQAATQQKVMAIVAHEATNVARCIASWATPLAAAASGPEVEGLRAIAWGAEVELEILRDLVEVTRISTQQLRSSFVTIDVAEVARRAVAALAPRAEAARVELGGRFAEALVVQGEPTRLAQLMLDVMAMSIGLAGVGGHVLVSGETTASELTVVVSRSGRDLRRDELEWNLDRIETDATVAISGRGAGMSLFVARQLTELHGGRLAVEAAAGLAGPTVRVILPRPRSVSTPPPPRSQR